MVVEKGQCRCCFRHRCAIRYQAIDGGRLEKRRGKRCDAVCLNRLGVLGQFARFIYAIVPYLYDNGQAVAGISNPLLCQQHAFINGQRGAFSRGTANKNTGNPFFLQMLEPCPG